MIKLIEKQGMKKALKNIDGMYAFITYDKINKKFFFVTDPQGEKRFFIYSKNDLLIISSTIKAIKTYLSNVEINTQKSKEYFFTRHMLFFKDTFYKDILLSMPGTINEISNNKVKSKFHYNCLNFINKNKYFLLKKMKNEEIIRYFDNLFLKQIKTMIPERNFGSIVSGGVDSSLISYYLKSISKPRIFAGIDHIGKDKVIKKTHLFEKKLKSKIDIIKLNSKKYFQNLNKVYNNLEFPFLTHDYISRHLISKFFREKKCKVFFSGDGADEIFGGYFLYSKVKWKLNKNSSPYSSVNKKFNSHTSNQIDLLWKKAFKRFSAFVKPLEASMQASLFTDYFVQGVSVANIGTDILSGENSIETRNPFIQKKILENAINLPIKYKINLRSKDKNMICKPLLKEIFVNKFGSKLLFPKQGFSGFPNESLNFFQNKLLIKFKNFKKNLKSNSQNRSTEWKILNLFLVNEYLNIK